MADQDPTAEEVWVVKIPVSLMHSIRGVLDYAVGVCPHGMQNAFQETRDRFLDVIIGAEENGR